MPRDSWTGVGWTVLNDGQRSKSFQETAGQKVSHCDQWAWCPLHFPSSFWKYFKVRLPHHHASSVKLHFFLSFFHICPSTCQLWLSQCGRRHQLDWKQQADKGRWPSNGYLWLDDLGPGHPSAEYFWWWNSGADVRSPRHGDKVLSFNTSQDFRISEHSRTW